MLYRNSKVNRARRIADLRRVSRAKAIYVASAVALALASAGASAANWEVAPRVQGAYVYNDNYYLELPGGEIEVSGIEADAAVTFRTIDPRTTFEITPRVLASYFPDESDEDSTDYFLSTRFHDETPRRRAGIKADFSQQDVSRSEFPTTDIDGGLGDPDDLASGRVIQRTRRDLIHVAPYFSYDISQRWMFDADAHFIDASFDETLEGFQQDFRDTGIAAGFGMRLSPRSSLTLRGTAARFETASDADAYGAYVEWATDYSQTSRFYLRVGGQQTEPERGESETDVIAGIGGRWQSPRNRLFLDLTRTVGPTSGGTIVERHQLRFRLDHDISERVTSVLGARFSRHDAIDELSTYPRREYAVADAGLEWRIQRQWSLTATYTYRWQEYEDEPSDASSNRFMIGIIYEPRRAN